MMRMFLAVWMVCAIHSVESAEQEQAAPVLTKQKEPKWRSKWDIPASSLPELQESLARLDEDSIVFGVYERSKDASWQDEEPYAEQLRSLNIPILEAQKDGSYKMPETTNQQRQLSLSTRHLNAARNWMNRSNAASHSNLLELGVAVSEEADHLDVKKLELGAAGRILWFIYEEDAANEQKSQVEFRIPF